MAKIQLKNIVKSWGQSVGVKRMSLDIADGEFLELQSHEVVLPARLVVRSSSAHRKFVEVPV